ncbi:hypothetical protein ACLOJK_040356 [Asimina triloba]
MLGGRGFARNITYENIKFTSVKNPLIINQYYCLEPEICPNQTDAVQVSNLKFADLRGTSTSEAAINLSCSETVACAAILLHNVNFTSAVPGPSSKSYCLNAQGSADGLVEPSVPCLAHTE